MPTILGSDGCGKVVEVGESVDKSWIGKSVVINPTTGWNSESPAMHNLEVLGMPKEGTLAEYVVVEVSRVKERPAHLTEFEAASLPLAGVTAYRALFNKGEAKKGHAVFVTGIGSGVSTFAAQFAAAVGCRVVVSSSSQEKLDEAVKRHSLLGGVLYTAPVKEWTRAALDMLGGGSGSGSDAPVASSASSSGGGAADSGAADSGGFDIIIDGAAGRDFNDLLRMLKPGGRFVSYGGTSGKPVDLDIFRIFLLQLKILGTSMGSDQDFDNMLQFVEDHRITPVIGETYQWEVRTLCRPFFFHHYGLLYPSTLSSFEICTLYFSSNLSQIFSSRSGRNQGDR